MRERERNRGERGTALITATIVSGVLVTMVGGYFSVTTAQRQTVDNRMRYVNAEYLARAGISEAIWNVRDGFSGDLGETALGDGIYQVAETAWSEGNDEYLLLRSTGQVLDNGYEIGEPVRIEVLLLKGGVSPVYTHAIFAGNSSGDPSYEMEFGGDDNWGMWNDSYDIVNGPIYSGGDVRVSGDAEINGEIQASGQIIGETGETGVTLPIPDIAAMDYPNNHDVDVAAAFAADGVPIGDSDGGFMVPEDDPAHIFRLNADDRSSENDSTVKDDYYLEDPYENVHVDPNQNGSDPTRITLSGGSGAGSGPNGNNLVYYIDGNLWIHNKHTYSFQIFFPEQEGVRVTFVVRGNIYISDNLFLTNQNKDAIAFIAMADPDVEDSGNVYIGDPAFGTVKEINAFMYAENDFVDNNLNASGSKNFTINGTMTAGNQVRIQRDFGGDHSRMTVNLDDRIATGSVTLPGLPSADEEGGDVWTRLSFRVMDPDEE